MGSLFALLSALTIAGASLTSKKALDKEHSLGFALVAHMAGFLLLVPLIAFIDLSVATVTFGWIYLASWFGAIGFLMITKAMRHLEVSIVVPLLNLSVILLILIAWAWLGERPDLPQTAGILLIAAGGYLLETNHHGMDLWRPFRLLRSSPHFHHLAFGIVLYALSGATDKYVLRTVPPLTYLFYIYLLLTFNYVLLVFVLRPDGGFRAIIREARSAGSLTFAFVLLRLLSNAFYMYAVSMVFVAVANAIKRTSALVTVLLSGRMFHERHIAWKIGVCSLMLAGVFLAVFG